METKNKGCMDTVMSYCTTFEEKLSKKCVGIIYILSASFFFSLCALFANFISRRNIPIS